MPTKTSTILGPKWTWKKIKRMKIANMRVIIDFIKHKKKIKSKPMERDLILGHKENH